MQNPLHNILPSSRTAFALFSLGALFVASGCGGTDGPTTETPHVSGAVRLSIDNTSGTAVSLAPKSATLVYGYGILLKAQVVDAAGVPVAGAKATWRSTNPTVATATAMADSGLASDYGRAAISSIGPGTALIIAWYDGVADTATITVVPRPDTPTTTPPERAEVFDITFVVRGVLPAAPGLDSASRYQLLPGAKVTLTLLPLQVGDSVAAGTPLITTPTLVGTATTDANGRVKFSGLTVTRYQFSVEPAAGSGWASATGGSSPPYWGQVTNEIWLHKQ